MTQHGFRQRRESVSGESQTAQGPQADERARPDELESVVVKHQVGEVRERGQNVLRQIVDVIDVRHGASDV